MVPCGSPYPMAEGGAIGYFQKDGRKSFLMLNFDDANRVFLTSDHHFGHANIIKWRTDDDGNPLFDSVEKMNDYMVARWNAIVGPDDVVLYLGDLAMGQRQQSLQVVSQLNGNIVFFPGNHDYVHPYAEKGPEWHQIYLDSGINGIFVDNQMLETNVAQFWLSHFPPIHDREGDFRYDEWRPPRSDDMAFYFHGHCHHRWKLAESGNMRMLNVGVDVHDFEPITLEMALELLLEGEPDYVEAVS